MKHFYFGITLLAAVILYSCQSSDNGSVSDHLPIVRETYMVDCPVSGTVANKDYRTVLLFRADQNWNQEKPAAKFHVKKGNFSGTVRMDTTLVYDFVFTVPASGMAQVRPFVPTQTGVHVVCPETMAESILLESTSPENVNLNNYAEIHKGMKAVSDPIYQEYNQLVKEERLYNDAVNALVAEARTAPREKARELWDQYDKLKNRNDSYSEEGLEAKLKLDEFNALLDGLSRDYLIDRPMLSSFYLVWHNVETARQQGKDLQPWLDVYENHYAGLFPDHPYHAMILGLVGNNVGEKIRDFALPDADGVEHKLSELTAGKIAVVDFWASWCGSCRIRSKALKPLYEKYNGDDFIIVGVANEYNDDAKWRVALQRDGYPWVNLVAVDGGPYLLSNHAKVFLLDRDGTILSINPTAEEIEAVLRP